MDGFNGKDINNPSSDGVPEVPECVSVQCSEAHSASAHNKADSSLKADTSVKQDSQKTAETSDKRKKTKKKRNLWWLKASVISFVLAGFFSFLSELTASAEQIVVIILLLAFLILASILFDAIGVAVTSCDVAPIASMASRKVHGAKTALWLVKNSGTVSSICNDVIGDIFGIISGACSAAVVVKITLSLGDEWQRWLTIIISAVVSALTIGGKAFMKNIAINNSRDFVMFVARIVSVFNKDERKIRKKESEQKKRKKSENKTDSTAAPHGNEKDNPENS